MRRVNWAKELVLAEESARVALPPAEIPVAEARMEAPFFREFDLPAGTRDYELKLGIKARFLKVFTDRDLKVRPELPGWQAIPVPAAESPFKLPLPPNVWVSRVFLTALAGAHVKVIASVTPIDISFGRAKIEGTAIPSFATGQTYWYWASQISQPAETYSTWVVATATGAPYEVPDNKRLVVDLVTLSTDVKGAVQQVELLERKTDGTLYRFGGAFFDCVVPLHMRVPLSSGSQVWIRTYNWDTEDRVLWVCMNGWEEYTW